MAATGVGDGAAGFSGAGDGDDPHAARHAANIHFMVVGIVPHRVIRAAQYERPRFYLRHVVAHYRRMTSRSLLILLLAGCPQKGGGGALPQPTGVGCPTGSGVFVAVYESAQDGKGHTGWVLPLHDVKADTGGAQPYATIDQAAATAAGVPAPPPAIWLMLPGTAPCRATPGSYSATAITGTTQNISYGVELNGCGAPADLADSFAIGLVSDQPPSDCHIESPRPVAARLGQMDDKKQWLRPTKQTPIPDALAPIVPQKDCKPPACEMLWAFTQVDINNAPVAWAGAVNWLQIPANASPDTQCQWKAETYSGFFVPGPDGKAVKIDEGQEHPLLLTAVLADRSGARVLLATGEGEYTAYDLGGPKPTVARHLVWLLAPAEAYTIDDHIGPECGEAPPQQH